MTDRCPICGATAPAASGSGVRSLVRDGATLKWQWYCADCSSGRRWTAVTTGFLRVLNCGEGDMRINFDKGNAIEVERAKRVIQDMLKRGYALFVEIDGKPVKVQKFDPETDSYIIADGPLYAGDGPRGIEEKPAKIKRGAYKRAAMATHRATAVAPTAGG